MIPHLLRQRHNRREVRDIPIIACKTNQVDHPAHNDHHEHIHPLAQDCVSFSYAHQSNPVRSSSLTFPPLPRKRHQPGIQRQRQEEVTDHDTSQRRHRLHLRDRPTIRHKVRDSEHYHSRPHNNTKAKAEPKFAQGLGYLDEEVGELKCLGRSAPGHVDLEHVGQQRLGHVDGQPAQEDAEHEHPLEVF